MFGELQQKKWMHFFKLFDTDQDGFIEQADLETLVNNLTRQRGLAPGSPGYDAIHGKWLTVWAALQKSADTNRDNVVSPAEWLALAEQIVATEESYQAIPHAIGMLTFDLLDMNGDGRLTSDEWRALFKAHGIIAGSAVMCFEKLDTNDDGFISKDEAMQHLRDYFYSNDPTVAGNWFFGPL